MKTCPKCGKPTKEWFGLGGKKFLGCSDIRCEWKKEIDPTPFFVSVIIGIAAILAFIITRI